MAHILIVDDSPVMLAILTETLEGDRHRVTATQDGREALVDLQGSHIDLVISDLNMPSMSGFEILENVRANKNLQGLPFIFLTDEVDELFRKTAAEAGATAWINKPFKPDAILRLVNSMI
jgi:two-component system, chemotaxis family, chemotaxis protein CheY